MSSHGLPLPRRLPAVLLGLGLVLLGRPGAALPGAGSPQALAITGNTPIAGRIAELELEAAGGILGRVEVRGIAWDGSASLLYREEVGAWTSRLPVRVLITEDLRFLEARAGGPGGESQARLGLEDSLQAGPAETERRRRLAALVPPFARYTEGPLPPWLDLAASSPEAAAREILPSLALGRPPLAALAVLAALALGAALAAGRRRKSPGPRPIPLPALALACLAVALGSLALLPREARLIIVDLPPRDSQGLVSGRLAAGAGPGLDKRIVRYANPKEAGELSLLLLSTPGESSLPLGDLALPGDDLVLSGPLLIVGKAGGFEVRTDRALSGWRIHGHP